MKKAYISLLVTLMVLLVLAIQPISVKSQDSCFEPFVELVVTTTLHQSSLE